MSAATIIESQCDTTDLARLVGRWYRRRDRWADHPVLRRCAQRIAEAAAYRSMAIQDERRSDLASAVALFRHSQQELDALAALGRRDRR